MKYIKEFRTSKMCHKCVWDSKTEMINEPLLDKRNVKFHGQLEQYSFDTVLKLTESFLNTFKMVNIYDFTIKTRKQRKKELKDKIFMETILNKEDKFCSNFELKLKKNKQHNEYRTTLLKKNTKCF